MALCSDLTDYFLSGYAIKHFLRCVQHRDKASKVMIVLKATSKTSSKWDRFDVRLEW